MKFEGEHFIHQKDSKLHTSHNVEHEQKRRELANEETHHKPAEKLADWMEILDRTHTGHRDDPRVAERIKDHYHKEHVIKKEDIPEAAFILEQRIARNLGHGDVEITEEFREQKSEQIIGDQEQSLDGWIDYLTSRDADVYPTWAKYWAFNSVTTMGKYEKSEDENGKETARFSKRTNDTVTAFPPLNAAAFAMTVGVMQNHVEQKNKPKGERITSENISTKLSDEEFKNLLTSENFSKLYAQFLIEQPVYSSEGLKETRGEWVTYPRGSEPDVLVQSLEGYPLEWCIRNSSTARDYLKGGDMHIYYSIDADGTPIVPRLAIRMEENSIAEVRGIAGDQNLDPYISPVVEDKMKEFPDGEKYQKKSEDMKRVTDIEERVTQGEQLTKDDLTFLYETNGTIEGFGYQRDPRIEELQSERNRQEDIMTMCDCVPEHITHTFTELNEDTQVYCKDTGTKITLFDFREEKNKTKLPQLIELARQFKEVGTPATPDLSFEGGVFTIDIDPELEKALTTWETAKQAFKDADGASKSLVWDKFDTDLKDQYESLTHNTLDCVVVEHGATTPVEREKLIEDMETAGYRRPTLAELVALGITHPEFNKRNEYLTTLKKYSLGGSRLAPYLRWNGVERALNASGVDVDWGDWNRFLFVRK